MDNKLRGLALELNSICSNTEYCQNCIIRSLCRNLSEVPVEYYTIEQLAYLIKDGETYE